MYNNGIMETTIPDRHACRTNASAWASSEAPLAPVDLRSIINTSNTITMITITTTITTSNNNNNNVIIIIIIIIMSTITITITITFTITITMINTIISNMISIKFDYGASGGSAGRASRPDALVGRRPSRLWPLLLRHAKTNLFFVWLTPPSHPLGGNSFIFRCCSHTIDVKNE